MAALLTSFIGPQVQIKGEDAPRVVPELISRQATEPESICSKITFGGYLNAGFLMNTRGADWNGNTATGSKNGGGLQGLYLMSSKKAESCRSGGDWGYGVDFLFGEDTRYIRVKDGFDEQWWTGTDGDGNPWYGFAMPQLYGEYALGYWTARAGHFYTTLGYESIRASERFFYSPGLSYDSLPATHTGGTLTYSGIKDLTVMIGWVNGNDMGFTDEYGGSLVLSSINYQFSEKIAGTYSFAAGDFSRYQLAGGKEYQENGSIHTWILNVKPNDSLELVTTADYQAFFSDGESTTITTFGQHILRRLNDCWRLGLRGEWQRQQNPIDRDYELIGLTLGVNWSPTGNDQHLLLRPEIRYDHSTLTNYGSSYDKPDQVCLGMDFLYKF